MKSILVRTSLFTATLLPGMASAHFGEHRHGFAAAVQHLLSDPEHLSLLLIAVVAGAAGAFVFGKRAK